MKFCSTCNHQVQEHDQFCSVCGTRLNPALSKNDITFNDEPTESYELHPRFVFVYELLPSCFTTFVILLLLLGISVYICNTYHYDRIWVVILFAILFVIKEFKIFFRKWRYRNVKYTISNRGIEYIDKGTCGGHRYIPYEEITDVLIQKNIATYLFGYGHILVKNGHTGIYLDYIANVNQVYEYIINHVQKR